MHAVKLPLMTTEYDELILKKRFFLLNKCHNILVKRAKMLLRVLRRNKAYRKWKEEYVDCLKEITRIVAAMNKVSEVLASGEGGKEDRSLYRELCEEYESLTRQKEELSARMSQFRESVGLSKTGLEAYIKVFQWRHRKNLSSHIVQEEAARVMKGVDAVLFGNGKDIHFRKINDMHSISTKSTGNGIRFYDLARGIDYTPRKYNPEHLIGIEFLGLDITIRWSKRYRESDYLAEAMEGKLSYCMITREWFNSGWRYYVVLTLSGDAPKRFSLGKGTMGGDPGTSTFAAAGENMLLLEELAPRSREYNKQISRLQQKIDRSKRLSNPGNYNPDGTVKKGKRHWDYSRTCLKDQGRLRTLYRKKSDYIRHEHNERANRILRNCDTFINEEMNFSALAKRSGKALERQENVSLIQKKDGTSITVHKFKRKRRFGKSINDRAPALQCTAIKEKLETYGGTYLEVDPKVMKGSQYRHDSDTYIRAPLGERFKEISGCRVQRDLYSAYIHAHASPGLKSPDRKGCIRDFKRFVEQQNDLIKEMTAAGKSRPACFGF